MSGLRYLLACLLISPLTFFYDIFGSSTRTDIIGLPFTSLIGLLFFLAVAPIGYKLAPVFAEWLGRGEKTRSILDPKAC